MNNKQQTRNFTPSDDALIKETVTRIGLKTLATMLHVSQEKVMRRADDSVFCWPPVMIMRALSTRERSVPATDSSTRY